MNLGIVLLIIFILFFVIGGILIYYFWDDITSILDPLGIMKDRYGRGAGKPMGCQPDEEKDGALCYSKCKDGYNGVGPVCWKKCPEGDFTDTGTQCTKKSYGRGVGKPLSTCPTNMEKDGLLCYPTCKSGYKGVGPVCWSTCPSGFRDDGAFCAKPKSYGRGAGRVPDVVCPSGFKQRGVGAAAWCDNGPTWPWKLKTRSATITCRSNEEKSGGLCYPQCRPGYHAVGCCVCSPNCPSEMKDIGASCAKKSYGRGAGKAMSCKSNEVKDAALCYPKCRTAYKGVGPVCWAVCPKDGFTDTGTQCTKKSYGRGVGKPLSTCSENTEKSGLLCYPKCKDGYKGEGPFCVETFSL